MLLLISTLRILCGWNQDLYRSYIMHKIKYLWEEERQFLLPINYLLSACIKEILLSLVNSTEIHNNITFFILLLGFFCTTVYTDLSRHSSINIHNKHYLQELPNISFQNQQTHFIFFSSVSRVPSFHLWFGLQWKGTGPNKILFIF